jgi:glycosyltransferase involved in cell wall biosynthesis
MRIVVLCTDLGIKVPGDKGASLHLASITRAFAGNGHEVLLVAVGGEPPAGAVADPWPAGVTHHRLVHPGRSEGLRREVRKLRFVRRTGREVVPVVRDFAPDVVYERLSLFGTAGTSLSERTGAHHVVEVNALLAREEATWRGLRLARLARGRERATLAHAALRVAVSREVAGQIDGAAPGRPTVVVPNGVEVERFAQRPASGQARAALGLPPGARLVAFVGAVRPWHGLDVAIRALVHDRRLELVVAGDGPLVGELGALATHLGVDRRVHWLGHRGHHEIPLVLAAADAAVAPYPALSDFGFSPLKVFEYLAAGVPVVASRIGQVTEVLEDGRWGTLVAPGDDLALARALGEVTGERRADALATADAARIHALDTFGWQRRAADIIECLGTTERRRNDALVG